MGIKLNAKQMNSIAQEEDLIIDNEIWSYIGIEGYKKTNKYYPLFKADNYRVYITHIFKRPSDEKCFRIMIYDDGFLKDCKALETSQNIVRTVGEYVLVSS